MIKIKNIARSSLVLAIALGALAASPARATDGRDWLDIKSSLKADALTKIESSTGAVLGPNGTIKVIGAEVVSASGSEIRATADYGNSSLLFVVKVDGDTKVNGSDADGKATLASSLKAGDKVSFSGLVTSSSSSSITVDGEHVISRAIVSNSDRLVVKVKKADYDYKGEVTAVADGYITVELKDGRTVRVNTSNSTFITVDGIAKSLSSIDEGDEVRIEGSLSAGVISATKISADSDNGDDDRDEKEKKDKKDKSDKDERKNEWKNRGWWNKILNWLRR